jgi:TPR repeat protein
MSADLGYPSAIYRYGECLWAGNGVERDLNQAAQYFFRGAEQGNISSLVRYGKCLCTGLGAEQNLNEAARYFWMAYKDRTPEMV